jgi:hypothetical protein
MHKRRRRMNFVPVMNIRFIVATSELNKHTEGVIILPQVCFLALMPQICFRKLTPPFDYSLKLTSFDIQETSVIIFCNKCLFVM